MSKGGGGAQVSADWPPHHARMVEVPLSQASVKLVHTLFRSDIYAC